MKILKICISLLILLMLFGCSKQNLYNKLVEYQEKVSSIIDQNSSNQEVLKTISYQFNQETEDEFDPDLMISRETFMAVYENQKQNYTSVSLDPILSIYKDLLDKTIEIMETEGIESAQASIDIQFREGFELNAEVSISKDKGVVFRMTSTMEEFVSFYGVKLGYEGDNFYIREFSQYEDANSFTYIEFLENNYVINIRYSEEGYWYQYISQTDETFYEISRYDYGWGEESILRWYNPETKIDLLIATGEEAINNIRFFNDKTVILEYSKYPASNDVTIRWQLLEADGWDSAYMTDYTTAYQGIYKNGMSIFDQVRQYNIDLNETFANVSVTMELPEIEVTNDLLQLYDYGLDFNHQEFTVDYINQIFDQAFVESERLLNYRDISFLDDNLGDQLYDVIDKEIKP